jgi:hypothetical protein
VQTRPSRHFYEECAIKGLGFAEFLFSNDEWKIEYPDDQFRECGRPLLNKVYRAARVLWLAYQLTTAGTCISYDGQSDRFDMV